MATKTDLTADQAAEKAYAEAAAASPSAKAKIALPAKAERKKKASKNVAKKASAAKANVPANGTNASAKRDNTKANTTKNSDAVSGVDLFKGNIMSKNAKTEDLTATMQDAAGKAQEQFKAAYDKSNEVTSEIVELSKGNMEAAVEAGKIFAAGVQEMGQTLVAESKEAMETANAEAKKLAGAKSPTEFFQLQNEIARNGFDMFMKNSSKNTEAFVKLANDAFAPLSTRASVAVEKMSKMAA